MSNSVLKTALNQGPAFGRRPLAIGTGLMLAGAFSLGLFFPTATFAQSDNPPAGYRYPPHPGTAGSDEP